MKKKWIVFLVGAALVSGLAVVGAGIANSEGCEIRGGTIRIENQPESDFPSMAKISVEQAVQKALASVQGRVFEVELEEKDGFLVYEVGLARTDKTTMDVWVDAGSGIVMAMDRERTDGENRESDEKGERESDD